MSTQQESVGQTRRQTDDFSKRVEYVAKDDTEQVATGGVMLPWELDFQGDFVRPDAIDSLAKGFDSDGGKLGFMHATFPGEDHVELAESRVLDESETIGDETYPAGTWVQSHRYTDDDAWELVNDDVLSGFSIGGKIEEEIWYSPGAAPDDLRVPGVVEDDLAEHDLTIDDVDVREIVSGRILEVSTVDAPAVPRAVHPAKSAGLLKGAPQLTESVVDAQLYLEERGHSEEDARRLAEYLDRTKSKSIVERAKRRIWPSGQTERGGKNSPETRPAEADTGVDAMLKTMDTDELSDTLNEIKAQNENLTERVDSLSEKVDESTDESESEAEEKGKSTDEQIGELTEAMKTLGENQEQILGRVERLSEAGGFSQQKSDGDTGEDEPSALAKSLGLENMGRGGA